MSKDITIKQDGTTQNISGATDIHTTAAPTGNVRWKPEDEIVPYITGTIDGVEYIVTSEDGELVYTQVNGGTE